MTAADLDRELDDMANRELLKDAAAPTTSATPSALPVLHKPADEKNLAVLTHVATLAAAIFTGGLLHVFVPAVALLLFRDKSAFLRDHARAQLNFQLTALLVAIGSVVAIVCTLGVGVVIAVPVLVIFFLTDLICSLRAAIAASRGEDYAFPFSLELIS